MTKFRNIKGINFVKIISLFIFLLLISRNYKEIKNVTKLYLNYSDMANIYSNFITDRDATSIIKELEEVSEPIRNHFNQMIYVIPEFMNPNLVDSHQAIAFALLPCRTKLVADFRKENLENADFLIVYNKKLSELEGSNNYKTKNQSNFYTLLWKIK